MAEDQRRTSARQRTVLRGCVYYDKRSLAADCVVRDVSDGGARIELSENVVIPDVIELYIPKKEETHHARVRWRRNNEVGVAYVENGKSRDHDRGGGNLEETAEQEHKGIGLEDRMQRLEAEMASFRRTIKSLLDEVKARSLRLPV
jgi:hypothetical protein